MPYATIASPEAWWLRVLSIVPPLAPILMPARLALGTVAGWEMAVAVLLTLGGVYGMARGSNGLGHEQRTTIRVLTDTPRMSSSDRLPPRYDPLRDVGGDEHRRTSRGAFDPDLPRNLAKSVTVN